MNDNYEFTVVNGCLKKVIFKGKPPKTRRKGLADDEAYTVELPPEITSIGFYAFKDVPVSRVILPDKCLTIKEHAFEGCTHLQAIEGGDIRTVQGFAFNDCNNLKDVSFLKGGNNLTWIWEGAFSNCTSLKEVALSKAKVIGPCAFKGCTSLNSVIVSTAKTNLCKGAFAACNSLDLRKQIHGLSERDIKRISS